MGKLTNLIRRLTRPEPARMGFGSEQRGPVATVALVAIISERWAAGTTDAVAAGADAVLLKRQPGKDELAAAVAASDGRAVGLLDSQTSGDEPSEPKNAGVDFIAVERDAPAGVLLQEDLSFVIHLNEELTDVELRFLEARPFEAIFLEAEAVGLTIRQQMELQRVSGLARTPLLLRVPSNAQRDDLLCLREAGVALVATDSGGPDELRRLRGIIDALPARRQDRREERAEITLPRQNASADEEYEEEE